MGPEHLRPPEDATALYRDERVRLAAFMLMLVQTGTEFEPGIVEGIINSLADAAEEHTATPDTVENALEWHEPTLKPRST